jgi:hypothetical protein
MICQHKRVKSDYFKDQHKCEDCDASWTTLLSLKESRAMAATERTNELLETISNQIAEATDRMRK